MIEIRKATGEDILVLRKLANKIIPDAFKSTLNTSQIDYMLDKFYSQKALTDAFDKGQIFFIANCDGEDTGLISFIEQGPNLYLMQKIYVEIKNQNKGIGSALLEKVKNYILKKDNSDFTLELIINRHNPGLSFYKNRGFIKVRDQGLDMEEFYINEEIYSLVVKK